MVSETPLHGRVLGCLLLWLTSFCVCGRAITLLPHHARKRIPDPNLTVPQFDRKTVEQLVVDLNGNSKICKCAGPALKPTRPRLQPPPKHPTKRKVILVTVSDMMDMFLEATLKCNKDLVDKVIVVTPPDDHNTQKLCNSSGVTCHLTEALHLNGDPFNKGRALKELQHTLHSDPANDDAIIMFVDNDICLPSDFWSHMPTTLNKTVLYSSVDRCMFENAEDYSRGWPAVQVHWSFQTLGMFQMYVSHAKAPTYDLHPEAGGDIQFGDKFKKIHTIPLFLNHIGGAAEHPGANWKGHRDVLGPAWRLWEKVLWKGAVPPPDGTCPCCHETLSYSDDDYGLKAPGVNITITPSG